MFAWSVCASRSGDKKPIRWCSISAVATTFSLVMVTSKLGSLGRQLVDHQTDTISATFLFLFDSIMGAFLTPHLLSFFTCIAFV
mmetsp:Transcript_15761/g.40324  ORF Transcript_15761/g.40324 Transcript_15761/m.40324 type:complete len:84 (-) Transcript_15761:53-304(-)